MNTAEVARYLGINEKKVYVLVREKRLPATKITGKWLFSKQLVDAWIEGSIENYPRPVDKIKNALMIGGSDDPLLDLILDEIRRPNSGFFPFFCRTGSLGGLLLLKTGSAHFSCSHLLDSEKEEYNLSFIQSYLPDLKAVLVNFAYREQGLIVAPRNPLKVERIEDLADNRITFVNRQKGSGTRILLDSCLKKSGIPASTIIGYETEVNTHFEVGLRVLRRLADVGIGIRAIAHVLGLGFIPLRKEQFDILIPKDYFFSKGTQMFVEVLRSNQFKVRASELGGYDTVDAGKIVCET